MNLIILKFLKQITEYKMPFENMLTLYYLKVEDSGLYECRNLNGNVLQVFNVQVDSQTNDEATTPVRDDNDDDNQSSSIPENDEEEIKRQRAPHTENYGRIGAQINFVCGSNPNDRVEWKRLDGGRVSFLNTHNSMYSTRTIFNHIFF
jgi:hypothetical protein